MSEGPSDYRFYGGAVAMHSNTMVVGASTESTVVEEAARTSSHFGDLGGVPERDVSVEARGALKHYGKRNERTLKIR